MDSDQVIWRLPLPLPDAVLELSPRWGQFAEPWQAILFFALSLLPLLLIVGLYRYELRLVRLVPAITLLTLRVVFFLLLWFLVALQPVVAHVTSERLPSRVVIAVDRSQSMEFADPGRGRSEALCLARSLKLQGRDPADTLLLDTWIAHHDKMGSTVEPPFADKRQRDLYAQMCRAAGVLTRTQAARRILEPDGLDLLDQLGEHQVELVGFDQIAWEQARLTDLFQTDDERRAGTNLRAPLSRSATDSDKGKLLGIILLSDGRHNADVSPLSSELEPVPVYSVALGARRAPADLAVVDIKAPSSVFKDADASFEARLRVVDMPAQELTIELRKRGEATPLETKTIQHDGSVDAYTVSFQQSMKDIGTHDYEITLRGSKETREASDQNNSLAATVRVTDDKARVLLVDGEARWEYHFIAGALARDETVSLDRVVHQQPRLGTSVEAELEKTGHPRRKLPEVKSETDPLLDYDCIILGDVAPEDLPLDERKRLEKYVSERGGTLIVVAGKRFMPAAFARAAATDDPLLKLLPISAPREIKPAAGFALKFTHDGSATPFLQMDPVPERNTQRWAKMPAHFWGMAGLLKPGATALVYSDEKTGLTGNPETTQALFAQQNYGFGKVLYIGLDSTWRWRYRSGDTYHHRFWGQVTRWAAAEKLLPAGNRYVRFGTREPAYREGQRAEILVRLSADTPPLAKDGKAAARLIRLAADGKEDKEGALVQLKASAAQPRLLQGDVADLPHASYRIKLDIPDLQDKLADTDSGAAATFTVSPSPQRELRDLSANWPLLEELARKSNGQFFTAENVEQVVALLARQITVREQRTEQRIWQDSPPVWWVLAILLLLVTVEWVVRKMVGLP